MAIFTVYQYPEGISLNGREYLLDEPDGDVMQFPSLQSIYAFFETFSDKPIESMQDMEDIGLYIERMNVRERIWEMLDEQQIDSTYLLNELIRWVTDEELEEICRINEIKLG